MLFERCLPVLILCSMFSFIHNEPELRVIGGELCSQESSTFAVSIQKSGFHFCGGSLIRLDVVLTASHCMVNVLGSYIEIVIGITKSRMQGIQRRSGKHIYIHEDDRQDIAIIELDRPFVQTPRVSVVSLPTRGIRNLEFKCPNAMVMGWGHKKVLDPTIEHNIPFEWDGNLNCASLSLLNNTECQKYVPDTVYDWVFCAWYQPGGIDACIGDSGGPMVCDGIQIGIVSSGYGCGLPMKPAFYVRVDSMLDFIHSRLNYHQGRSTSSDVPKLSVVLLVLSMFVFFVELGLFSFSQLKR